MVKIFKILFLSLWYQKKHFEFLEYIKKTFTENTPRFVMQHHLESMTISKKKINFGL